MDLTVCRRWTAAWLGGPVIGIANGIARERLYTSRVGEQAAHQLSTGTAIAGFAGYFSFLQRRWPLPTSKSALTVGTTWVALTMLFEFGFGHYVSKRSWTELTHDYDLLSGRVWLLVLIWLGLGPEATRRLHRGGEAR